MLNKRKVKRLFKQGQLALSEEDYQQAVYFFKLVIETSIKYGGIQLNDCFSALVCLGDIYTDARCFEEADQLYRMAAGMDFSAKFILLKKELFHEEPKGKVDKKEWLKKNMLDFTDIIQAVDGKTWAFLIKEGDITYQGDNSSKRVTEEDGISEDSFWLYEEYLDTPIV